MFGETGGGHTKLHTHDTTEEQHADGLDLIFDKLQYTGDEYPFERGWCGGGCCTSKMVLALCKKHNMCRRAYKDSVEKGSTLDCYIPVGKSRVQVNFFVRDDHCFWYGKPLAEKGASRASN